MTSDRARVAHSACVQQAGETLQQTPSEYDPQDEAQWLLQNMQPHWPCAFCGRPMADAPVDEEPKACTCKHAGTGRPPGTYGECDPDCGKCAEDYADFLSRPEP